MVDLLFDWFGISCITTDNICFYLQNRLIKTSQTGGKQYRDTFNFSIPCWKPYYLFGLRCNITALMVNARQDILSVKCLFMTQ